MKEKFKLQELLAEIKADLAMSPEDKVLLEQDEIADLFPVSPAPVSSSELNLTPPADLHE